MLLLITQAHNWLVADKTKAAMVLEAAHLGSYEFFQLHIPWWDPLLKSGNCNTQCPLIIYRPITPLWFKPSVKQLFLFSDPNVLASKIIYIFSQVCTGDVLQTFDSLKLIYSLPNTYRFRYLQLRHTFQLYFRNPVHLTLSGLESLLREETLDINPQYMEILTSFCPVGAQRFRSWIQRIFGITQCKTWSQSGIDWYNLKFVIESTSLPNGHIHFSPPPPSKCWRCLEEPATFFTCVLGLSLR